MKAVVWHGPGDIGLDTVPDPKISEPTDAVIRITRSAICGTDLHLVRGTMPGMRDGTVLGHEAVGVVEQVGSSVRGFSPGDRVVVTSTIVAAIAPTAVPATTRSASVAQVLAASRALLTLRRVMPRPMITAAAPGRSAPVDTIASSPLRRDHIEELRHGH